MSSTDDRRHAAPVAGSVVAAERARRLAKLERLRERGIPRYPVRFDRDWTAGDMQAEFAGLAAGEETDITVRIADRAMLIRRHGGLQAVLFVPAYVALVLTFGTVSLLMERDHAEPGMSVGDVLETVFGGLVGLSGPYAYDSRFFGDFIDAALPALGSAGLVVLFALVFRAVTRRTGPTAEDRERASRIVHAYGSDTLAYFALRDDKSYSAASMPKVALLYASVEGFLNLLVVGRYLVSPAR